MATLLKIRGLDRASSSSDVSATTGASSMSLSKGARGFRIKWGLGTQQRGTGGVAGALTIGAANAAVTYTANWPGTVGNNVKVAHVVAGNNTAFSIVVTIEAATGKPIITVNAATDGGGLSTTTATVAAAAVNNHPVASQYVSAVAGGTGASVITAAAAAALTGGTNGAGSAEPIYLSANSVSPVTIDIDDPQTARSLRRNVGRFVSLGQP
jgi:hypothetical protein